MINTSSKGTVHRQKSGNDKAQCDTLHINFAEQAENTTNQRTFASSLFSPFNYSFKCFHLQVFTLQAERA